MDCIIKLCKMGQIREAFHSIENLVPKGVAISRDDALHLMQSCGKIKDLGLTRQIHALMVESGLESVPILVDHMIRLFTECGCLYEANLVFGKVAECGVHTWSSIIGAYATLGQHEEVFKIYNQMIDEGIMPDKFIFMSIIKSCCSNNDLARGELMHKKIIEHNVSFDVIMGSTLVDMYAKCGNLEMAYE